MKSKKTLIVVVSLIVLLGVAGFLFLYKIPNFDSGADEIQQSKVNFSKLVQLKKGEEISYDESLEKWTSLKTTNGNSYIYSIKNVSWVGSGSITEIEVRNGVVVSKKFESHDPDNNIDESFIEVGSKIDSHKKTPARTIDQLYSECSVEYLSVNTGNIFTASTEGIMIACGYRPIGCVDDCFQGVTIDSLKWLSK